MSPIQKLSLVLYILQNRFEKKKSVLRKLSLSILLTYIFFQFEYMCFSLLPCSCHMFFLIPAFPFSVLFLEALNTQEGHPPCYLSYFSINESLSRPGDVFGVDSLPTVFKDLVPHGDNTFLLLTLTLVVTPCKSETTHCSVSCASLNLLMMLGKK